MMYTASTVYGGSIAGFYVDYRGEHVRPSFVNQHYDEIIREMWLHYVIPSPAPCFTQDETVCFWAQLVLHCRSTDGFHTCAFRDRTLQQEIRDLITTYTIQDGLYPFVWHFLLAAVPAFLLTIFLLWLAN